MNKIHQILNCIFKDRHNFDINEIKNIHDNKDFIYAILPYVARSFALSIVVIPDKISIPAALGYCYCRILDTFEDMVFLPKMREKAISSIPKILKKIMNNKKVNINSILKYEKYLVKTKKKDEMYCLLVHEIKRINDVFLEQEPIIQKMIYNLVKKMAKGMNENTGKFKEKNDNISKNDIKKYCKSVLGYPLLFIFQLLNWINNNKNPMDIKYKEKLYDISQFIQLANVTRDIEEDLLNNVVYHNLLQPYKYIRKNRNLDNPILQKKIKQARKELIIQALQSGIDNLPHLIKHCLNSYGTRLSMLLGFCFTECFYKNLVFKHYNISHKCSNKIMILKCCIFALFQYTTKNCFSKTINELNHLKLLLSFHTIKNKAI